MRLDVCVCMCVSWGGEACINIEICFLLMTCSVRVRRRLGHEGRGVESKAPMHDMSDNTRFRMRGGGCKQDPMLT